MLRIIAASFALMFMTAGPVFAQSGSRGTMVMDDGSQRFVLHYSEPDIDFATQPEFSRRDAELFAAELALSDPQSQAVGRLIERYLERFAELLEEKHPNPGARGDDAAQRAPGDGDGPNEDVEGGPGATRADPIRDIILEELRNVGIEASSFDDLPFSPSISIGISLEDDGSGQGPQRSVDVGLSFGGEDDRISEEMRAKLQKAADAAVPRITEHVKNRDDQIVRMGPPEDALPPDAEIARKWGELQELRARVDAFVKAKDALKAQLLADVRALLAEEQQQRWPSFERAFRRIKTMPWGEFVGEQVDLISTVAELELPVDRDIEALLDLYALQLDEALKRRNELMQTADADIDMALYVGELDEAVRLGRRFAQARQRICDLNSEFADLIAAALEAEDAAKLHAAVNRQANPRVYRATIGERAFTQAMELADLTEDQRTAIADLHQVHQQQLQQINQRIDATLREQQAGQLERQLQRVAAMIRGEDDEQAMLSASETIADAFGERRDLDVRMMRSLYAVLQPEQVAKLPKIPVTEITEPVRSDHIEIDDG